MLALKVTASKNTSAHVLTWKLIELSNCHAIYMHCKINNKVWRLHFYIDHRKHDGHFFSPIIGLLNIKSFWFLMLKCIFSRGPKPSIDIIADRES